MAADGITIGPDALKNILPLLGMGGAPPDLGAPAMPDVSGPPPGPPPPPPPTPAQAGFDAFAADPQNQKRTQSAITAPGQSILPPNIAAPPAQQAMGPTFDQSGTYAGTPSQMAALNPPKMAAPTPNLPPPSQPNIYAGGTPATMAALNPPGMTSAPTAQQSSQIQRNLWDANNHAPTPYLGKGAGKVGNILQFIAAGSAGAAGGLHGNPMAGLDYVQKLNDYDNSIPEIQNSRYRAAVVQPQIDAAQLADTQSQTALRTSQSNKADQQTDDMTPFTLSPAQAAAINHPELSGTTATMRDYSRLVGMAGNNNTSAGNNKATNDTKVETTGMRDDTSSSNNAATNAARLAGQKAKIAAGKGSGAPGGGGGNSSLVQAIIDGRAPAPTARSKAGMALMAQVTAADPTYDASRYNTYQAMQKEMTTGKTGANINALNTLINHINDARQHLPANGDIPAWNAIKNFGSTATGGNPTGKFDTDATGIGGEFGKLVSGGVASVDEQKHLQGLLKNNGSHKQMSDNLDEIENLAHGKLAGIYAQVGSAAHPGPGSNVSSALPANPMAPPNNSPAAGPAHSLATAMVLPFNKGKSAAQVTADLKSHGYTVVP